MHHQMESKNNLQLGRGSGNPRGSAAQTTHEIRATMVQAKPREGSFLPHLVGKYNIDLRKAIFNEERLPMKVRKKFHVRVNEEGTVFIRRRRKLKTKDELARTLSGSKKK